METEEAPASPSPLLRGRVLFKLDLKTAKPNLIFTQICLYLCYFTRCDYEVKNLTQNFLNNSKVLWSHIIKYLLKDESVSLSLWNRKKNAVLRYTD